MPAAPSIELISYVGWIFFAMIGLYITIQAFRNKISWGAARYMGIPMTIFAWMTFIYVLVLFEIAYGFVSFILDWPIWIEISLFVVVLVLSLGLYFKLLHREKFKSNLFVALFLVPLGIPGIPTAAKLISRVGPEIITQKVPRVKPRFPQKVQISDSGWVVEFPNPHSKGRLGDSLTARRLTARGYEKAISKIDKIHGIDGVYIKYDGNRRLEEILIVENKVDGSQLVGDQMTADWITRNVDKMVAHPDVNVRRTGELIRRNPGMVRKQLWHHDLGSGRTTISTLDDKARKSWVGTENYIGRLIRKRCESKNPTILCFPASEQSETTR